MPVLLQMHVAILALGLLVALSPAQAQPRVTVEQGELVGTTETFEESEFIGMNKSVDVFRGYRSPSRP